MQAGGFFFFALFALVQVAIYLSVRREWFPTRAASAIGVIASILTAMMMSVAQGNNTLQAIIVGLLIGGLFSIATLAIAWYFHKNEMKQHTRNEYS